MALPLVLLGIAVATMLCAAVTGRLVMHYRQAQRTECQQQTMWLAESAVRRAVDRLVVLCHVRARDLTSNWALGPGFLVGLLQLPLARRAGAHEVLSSPP